MKKSLLALTFSLISSSTLLGCASQQQSDVFWKEHLVFVSARSGHNDIYLSDLTGKDVRQLTNDVADDAHPRISLDGHIVFSSRRTGTWQIYRMNWDGSDVKALTSERSVNNYRPYPSPDGRIIFVSDRELKPQIYSINHDGSDLVKLSDGDFHYDYPVVADDGLIYFTSSRGSKWDIWRMGPDGSRPTQITKISQNIQEIAIVSPIHKDYDERFTNRSPMLPYFGFYSQSRLIFSAYTETGNLALYRVNVDGSEFAQISNRNIYNSRSPVLQPTGQVLFTTDRNGSTDIWSMYPDGKMTRPIINNPAYDSTS